MRKINFGDLSLEMRAGLLWNFIIPESEFVDLSEWR
jgi:hypothetical protein